MKKILAIFLAILMAGTFIGCSNKKDAQDNTEIEESPEYCEDNFEEFLHYIQTQLTAQAGEVGLNTVNGSFAEPPRLDGADAAIL